MEKPVVRMNLNWEAKQMKEVYSEILGLIWKINPIYLAYFVFFAPRLLKTVCFFTPLLVSTCLLVLVIFSLGPQLERIRVEGDLQWKRFREAGGVLSLRAEDDRRFRQPTICCRDALHDESAYSSKGKLVNGIQEEVGVGSEKCGGSVAAIAEDGSLNPCQSIVANKIKVLMDRLVAELGGKVEFGVPNAIEAIAEALLETTLRQYEKDMMSSSIGITEDRESGGGLEDKTLRECPSIGLESVCFEPKNVGEFPLNAEGESMGSHDFSQMAYLENSEEQNNELEDKTLRECPSIGLESVYFESKDVGQLPLNGQGESMGSHDFSQMAYLENYEEQNNELHLPPCNVGAVQANAFEIPIARREELYAAKLPDSSQVSAKDIQLVDNVNEADPSHGLHDLEQCIFRSSRSFALGESREEFLTMDRLWEEDHHNVDLFVVQKNKSARKEKDWKRTLACKLYEEQHNRWKGTLVGQLLEDQAIGSSKFDSQVSPSTKIPERLSHVDFLRGKSTSSSSESQALTSAESSVHDEEMDQLWEEYNDAPGQDTQAPIKGLRKGLAKLRRLRQNVDSDAEDGPESPQLCCLRAFKFSMGKMPLRRPSFMKFSKALKNFGLIQQVRGQKQ